MSRISVSENWWCSAAIFLQRLQFETESEPVKKNALAVTEKSEN